MVNVNPGAGPCERGTIDQAYANMYALTEACRLTAFRRDTEADEKDGRFAYVVTTYGGSRVSVLMPAVPFDVLTAGPLKSPRLYVDGNSWFWPFAVRILNEWDNVTPPFDTDTRS